MRCSEILVEEFAGGNPCTMYLPKACQDGTIATEVIKCTAMSSRNGCSIMRIYDPEGLLADIDTDNKISYPDGSECKINRISSKQLVAVVKNRNCKISNILSKSGCFVTSAVMESPEDESAEGKRWICWTVIAMDGASINNLIAMMTADGYNVKKKSTYNMRYTLELSDRQKEAVNIAVENGYYNVPRKFSVSQIAEIMKCSKTTADIALRTAEMKIVTDYYVNNGNALKNKK